MIAKEDFDVFLAHNSEDKSQVKAIGEALKRRDLKPWIDTEQIPPGRWVQEVIQQVIPRVKSVAIIIGPKGLGKWQAVELRAFISQCVEREIPVIPVLLPGVAKLPPGLLFLKELNWVDFKESIDETNTLNSLVWGITDKRPKPEREITDEIPPKKPTVRSVTNQSSYIIIFITSIILIVGGGYLWHQRSQPIEYTGRIIDDKTQAPVQGAKVSLDLRGVSLIVYTDSEGFYRFTVSFADATSSGRVRIDAPDYQFYDRFIELSASNTRIEEIRLKSFSPPPTPTPTPFACEIRVNHILVTDTQSKRIDQVNNNYPVKIGETVQITVDIVNPCNHEIEVTWSTYLGEVIRISEKTANYKAKALGDDYVVAIAWDREANYKDQKAILISVIP